MTRAIFMVFSHKPTQKDWLNYIFPILRNSLERFSFSVSYIILRPVIIFALIISYWSPQTDRVTCMITDRRAVQ